ncbi:ABC transporter ATP-binding protein [Acidisoma cellulosilytica]|uniref:ABC transporter ATP-binding protein n=1 Tax=Acidisoma cellulosilyticum TaxID=2802395 RepID=A0A963Z3U9_9PROT|nr:ABC transporter ATP-binding protein [Acidisoma cellulosilyticum]MCB8881427.1 ABC transporter ATP-binding protein [Acidisoma cellulosilyticum]
MLEVETIEVSYGRIPAVRGLSFRVDKGELVTIVGPNGAGKSTTMMTIAGALTPTRGLIRLGGVDITGKRPEEIARLGISFVPEGRHVFSQLTVGENLLIGADMRRDRAAVRSDYDRALAYFPILKERLEMPGGKLSGGEQQQLVIARALMTRPKVVLVDEPSLGLAPIIVDLVYDILRKLRDEGSTLVVVEQSTHRALENADRIYVVRNGQVTLEGASAKLTDKDLENAYFGFEDKTDGVAAVHF